MCHKCLNGKIAQIRWSLVDHNLKLLLNLERDCKVFFEQKKMKLFHQQSKRKKKFGIFITIMNVSHICVRPY